VAVSYTPTDAVIDTVAIILILLPEPATTALGIAMMARPRGKNKQAMSSKPLHNYPDYIYRVDNIRGRDITWEVRVTKAGQLPLQQPNRPAVKIKHREELILSRKTVAARSDQVISHTPLPGATTYHTIIKPPREIMAKSSIVPGDTIHHTLRTQPQSAPVFKQQPPEIHTHHTIEDSPGYIRAKAAGTNRQQGPKIVHHSLENSPAAQIIKPIKIEKPSTVIIEHHTLNTKPPIDRRGPLIPPASQPNKRNLPDRNIDIRKKG